LGSLSPIEYRRSLGLSVQSAPQLKRRFLDELSGGQRQRAFVAIVLAQDTDYMLFDEPLVRLRVDAE